MREIWTAEAKNTFYDNIQYLKKQWSVNEVNTFVKKSFKIIDIIKTNPEIGQYDERWGCRKFLVTSQVYLFYKVGKKNLILITFWNNYQKPID